MAAHPRATIVIPAFEPTTALVDLVRDLSGDPRAIVVVDDGSSPAAQPILERAAQMRGVVVLRHATNLGKGQALKSAFNHVLLHTAADECVGVVTADADGQHLASDIRRVAECLERSPDALVLGSRAFDGPVPLRSRVGNTVTRGVFRLLLGRPIADTQTGLRGIPRSFLPELLTVEAAHYEFELEMLVRAAARRLVFVEVPIRTVYGGDAQSHFNPLRDSVRIYFVFVRFLGLSLATAALDYAVFLITYGLGRNILASTAIARAVAGAFNFAFNRRVVFRSRGEVRREALRYATLVFALMWISYALITALAIGAGVHVYVAKLLADGALFVASFAVQDLFVFPDRERVRPASTTDWSAYYERPAALAPLTRRITARKLIATVDRVARGATLRHIVELGGGNSAFLRRFCERHPGAHVTAVDNNAAGLQLLARAFDGDPRLTTMEQDVLEPGAALKADLVFSTGLIEHFDRAGTSRAIAAHFEQARPGGLVIITYPTPTWLYRLVRGAAERLGVWSFPDERPLHDEEVVREAARHGDVLEVRTNWAIGLTQGILVARRRLQI